LKEDLESLDLQVVQLKEALKLAEVSKRKLEDETICCTDSYELRVEKLIASISDKEKDILSA
jgi:hypothetical protein